MNPALNYTQNNHNTHHGQQHPHPPSYAHAHAHAHSSGEYGAALTHLVEEDVEEDELVSDDDEVENATGSRYQQRSGRSGKGEEEEEEDDEEGDEEYHEYQKFISTIFQDELSDMSGEYLNSRREEGRLLSC